MNPLNKIRLFNNVLINNFNQSRNIEDTYCLQLLNKVLSEGNVLPLTSMSLRPYVLAFLTNELVINKRKRIIEFGAGISTLMLARTAKMNNLSVVIVSVEENLNWFRLIQEMLIAEHLQDYVHMIHAPLEEKLFKGFRNHWYQGDILKKALESFDNFDMVVIDGPTAFSEQIALSRYFAMPFLRESLCDNCVIFLDDANRGGEKKVMQFWKEEYDRQFQIYSGTLGVYYKGSYFDSNPMKFVSVQQVF